MTGWWIVGPAGVEGLVSYVETPSLVFCLTLCLFLCLSRSLYCHLPSVSQCPHINQSVCICLHYRSKVWGHLEMSLFLKAFFFLSIKISSNWSEIQCRHWKNNIDIYADSVSDFINKCNGNVVPTVTIKTYPNQKPWMDGSIRTKLKVLSTAFIHGKRPGNIAEY